MRTEKDIIDQLKLGHHDALAKLMSKYQNYVYSVLKAMLFDYEAEEATQDTFIKIFKYIGQYNEQSKLSTWIYSITYRTGLDYIKKRRIHQPIEFALHSLTDNNESKYHERADMKKWIDREIGKLKPEEAALIRLYYLNEYSIQEVADITGLGISNIKVKLYRIRNTMKQRMSHLNLSDLLS